MQLNRYISSLLLAGTLLSQVITSGCGGARVGIGYRVYDPNHTDYHPWDDREVGFYNQWVVETHRPAQREYRRLKRDEQREYWNWRHDHK